MPGMSPSPRRGPPGRGAVVLVVALGLFLAGAVAHRFLIDDAFISFRYARNWAAGHGLRYHVGSAPAVEGYSNFLWTAVLALGHRLGAPIETLAHGLTIACGALWIVRAHVWLARRGVGLLALAVGDLAFASSGAVWVWATSGLETMPFTLVFGVTLLGLIDLAREPSARSGAWVGLLALTLSLLRVEGVLWAVALPVLVVSADTNPRPNRRRLAAALAPYAVVLVVGYGAFLLARHATYGSWTPNTMLVKAGLSGAKLVRGLKSDASYLLSVAPLLLLGAGARASFGSRAGAGRSLGLTLVALLGYNALVGGDWMPFHRFLVPFGALGALALALAVDELGNRKGAVLAVPALLLGLGPILDWHPAPRALRVALDYRSFDLGYRTELERLRIAQRNGESFATIGRLLGRVASPGDSVVVGAIGAIGFYSGLVVHDRNGLVDPEVARYAPRDPHATAGHEKRVPWSWFADRRPTYYEPALVPAEAPLRAAAAGHARRLFEKDPALRELCVAEKRTVPGATRGLALLVLRGVEDPAEARRFWSTVLP